MNHDDAVVAGFGDEWARFDQASLTDEERQRIFEQYFGIFPWESLGPDATGMDIGCGSGRWASLVAPRVGHLICIDASAQAAAVATRNLHPLANCEVRQASIDQLPAEPGSLDFAYSLGVLHHVPDTQAALGNCTALLKPGAPFLLYLYYSFENRPRWFRMLWRASNAARQLISRLPFAVRNALCEVIAACVYWPLARTAALAERLGLPFERFPLSFYRHLSFYVMRTDARDRFGTQIEHRFSRAQITGMMSAAGLSRIRFSEGSPFWCAVGYKEP